MPFNFNDASMLSVLQTQTANINVRVMETPLTDITYPLLLPVNTGYAEWQPDAKAITIGAGVGEAKWITGYSKDVPLVKVTATGAAINFATFGVGYETNYEELGLAANAGIAIDQRKAAIARRKAEEFIQLKVLVGDADKGWVGMVNQTGMTILPAATKAATGTQWVNNDGSLNATAQEIAKDMINLIYGPVSATNTVRPIVADTVALPSLAFRVLSATFTDALNGGLSYLAWVQRAVQGVPGGANFQIVEIPELSSAATSVIVGGGRAIAYRRSQDIVEIPMPFAFRFLNDYRDAPYGYMVPGWARFGPVTVWERRGFRYMDGIQQVPA